jgi:hypothetical protein
MNSYNINTNWYTDTSATDHITAELEKLSVRYKYNGVDQILQVTDLGEATFIYLGYSPW